VSRQSDVGVVVRPGRPPRAGRGDVHVVALGVAVVRGVCAQHPQRLIGRLGVRPEGGKEVDRELLRRQGGKTREMSA
jgi:hypothetical protein